MPNTTAYAMLLIWPLFSLALFVRLPAPRALIWTILGGYLVLPPRANFDLPLLPPLDKVLIPNITAYLLCLFVLRERVPLLPPSRIAAVLVLIFVLGSIPTVLTNGDPVAGPNGMLPGLRLQDVVSAAGTQAVVLLPFLMARQLLASAAAQRDLLVALMVAGLLYSLPSLYEVVRSPVLNINIYGFFQHDFTQTIRYGGFRPIVFLPHPIWLALLMMMALVSAAALVRHGAAEGRGGRLLAMAWLAAVLVLCKTVGAMIYAVLALPLVLLMPPRVLVRVAVLLAGIAVIYPILRGGQVIPVEQILERIVAIDPERAASLGFRFANEETLLTHANERALFGWGGWGRNLLYDPVTGELETIPDGRWIITFGIYGWLGFLAEFGLLALPLALLWRASRRAGPGALSPHAAVVALLLSLNMFDLLPNATLVPLTWLVAGAVLGHAERLAAPRPDPAPAKKARPARRRTVI